MNIPTYFGSLIFGLPIWLFLFLHRSDLRHKMLIMSILIAFVAPVDTFFIPEYWYPLTINNLFGLPIDVFTILFGFILGGISSVLYEEFMGKSYMKHRGKPHHLKILVALGPLILFLLKLFTPFNFMLDVLIATGFMIVIMLFIRHDLFTDVILSGLFFAVVYSSLLSFYILIFPEILSAWNFNKFPQIILFNVPIYEIIWAFLSGAFLGPFYEFSHDFILRNANTVISNNPLKKHSY